MVFKRWRGEIGEDVGEIDGKECTFLLVFFFMSGELQNMPGNWVGDVSESVDWSAAFTSSADV